MKRRIPAGTRVESGWPCALCATSDSFIVVVHLGSGVYLENYRCKTCDYTLTESEAEALKTKAWEAAPEDAIGERQDAISERGE